MGWFCMIMVNPGKASIRERWPPKKNSTKTRQVSVTHSILFKYLFLRSVFVPRKTYRHRREEIDISIKMFSGISAFRAPSAPGLRRDFQRCQSPHPISAASRSNNTQAQPVTPAPLQQLPPPPPPPPLPHLLLADVIWQLVEQRKNLISEKKPPASDDDDCR